MKIRVVSISVPVKLVSNQSMEEMAMIGKTHPPGARNAVLSVAAALRNLIVDNTTAR